MKAANETMTYLAERVRAQGILWLSARWAGAFTPLLVILLSSARIAEELFETLDAPVRRVATADCPIPFSPVLEKEVLPQLDDVVGAVRELSAY